MMKHHIVTIMGSCCTTFLDPSTRQVIQKDMVSKCAKGLKSITKVPILCTSPETNPMHLSRADTTVPMDHALHPAMRGQSQWLPQGKRTLVPFPWGCISARNLERIGPT